MGKDMTLVGLKIISKEQVMHKIVQSGHIQIVHGWIQWIVKKVHSDLSQPKRAHSTQIVALNGQKKLPTIRVD